MIGVCKRGHALTRDNLYFRPGADKGDCRTCRRGSQRGLAGKVPPTHGVGGYTVYRCRCEVCSEANRVSKACTRYGITKAEYATLAERFASEGCDLCGSRGKDMILDHCHSSGRVRGAVCQKCNVGLGKFQDDPALLDHALKYLTRDKLEEI